MASALAKEKGFELTVDYIADLWYASKLLKLLFTKFASDLSKVPFQADPFSVH